MKKFFSWLITSSANPENAALTIKGIFGTIISLIVLVSPLAHLNVDQDSLNALSNALVQALTGFLALVSLIATVVGLIRKIKLTNFTLPAPSNTNSSSSTFLGTITATTPEVTPPVIPQ